MKNRKVFARGLLVAFFLAAAPPTLFAKGRTATVKGYVLDSACLFIKDLNKPVSPECAVACAQAGSPLVILAEDGSVYWPISASMPATGQNSKLIKFAGQKVTVSGQVYERGGSHAMVIKKIVGTPAGK